MAKKLFYKIGEACKQVDVQPYVLRYWETEFELLSPDKSKSGQRVYSEDDLAIIRRIKELLYDEGYTTVGAKKKLQAELEEGDGKLPEPSASKKKPKKQPSVKQARDQQEPVESEPVEPRPESQVQGEEPQPAQPAPDGKPDPESETEPCEGHRERVEELEEGLRSALGQAREILRRLA